MITEHLIQQLHALRLRGMADSLQQQLDARECDALRFEERINLMIQNEIAVRANVSLVKRLRWANIPIPEACIEDIDKHVPRELDPLTLSTVCEMGWLKKRLNVLITGPTGIGKSYLSSALANAAARAEYSVRCYRMSKLPPAPSRRLLPRGSSNRSTSQSRPKPTPETSNSPTWWRRFRLSAPS
jgi:DNA replication protein DnaC